MVEYITFKVGQSSLTTVELCVCVYYCRNSMAAAFNGRLTVLGGRASF